MPGSTGVPRRCSVWTQQRFSSMVWTGCQRIFLRCQLPHLSRTAACAGSEVPPPIPGCAAGPGCDGRPDPSASRRPSASCAGCRCKRQGLGQPPWPPLLSNHPSIRVWGSSVYGSGPHQGQGKQTQKDDGRGGTDAQSVSGRAGRGHRPGPRGTGQEEG